MFSDLDIFIQEKAETTEQYYSLRHEINNHIHDPETYPMDKLSGVAQEILMDFEDCIKTLGKIDDMNRATTPEPLPVDMIVGVTK